MQTQTTVKTAETYAAESFFSRSPALIFFFIALTVFVSEAAVMLLLQFLPQQSLKCEAFTDALLLVLIISPALYLFLFRPMVAHIRERRKVEEVLHKNEEEQFKIMIRASLDGFLITDMQGRFLEVNDAYCQLLGYSQEELLNMVISDVEAIESQEETARHIGNLIASGSGRFETLQRCRDGRILDMDVSVNYSNLHGGRLYCFLRDITGRKLAEQELRDAKESAEDALQKLEVSTQSMRVLTRAIEQSPVVNVITDVNGAIQYVNPKFCEVTGYTADEVTGENPRILNSGVQSDEFYAELWATITSGQEWHGEMCNKKKNGEIFWEYASISPVRNDEGEITQFIASKEDITERKQVEEELKLRAQILNSISDTIFLLDLEGNFIYLNEAAWKTRGYTQDEMMGMNLRSLNAPEQNALLVSRMTALLENGHGTFESAHRCKDGSIMPVEINARITESGGRKLLLSVIRDITERKRAEQALRASEANLRVTLDNLPYMVWLKDADGRYIAANQPFIKLFGGAHIQDVLGKTDLDLWPKDLAEKYRADDAEVMFFREKKLVEEITVSSGEKFWVETFKAPILEENGKLLGTTGFARDITERRRSEEKLRESESRLKELFENLSSGVAVYRASLDGLDFIITAFNRAAERIEKKRREELIGKSVLEVFPGIAEFGLLEVFRRVWQSGVAEHFPVYFYHDGRIAGWRENYIYRLPDGEVVAIYDDVTKEKQAEERMHHLAHYDALTGLPNRTLFADRLQQSLAVAKREKSRLAMMFLDLDKFKPVNDELGHDVGDLLLKEVANRMQNCVRESDTVSRIGGDEFVILLPSVEAEQDVMRVAEKILYALVQPFELASHSILISASIGVAVYPLHGSDERMLTKHADIAMYYAKSGGRNNARLYQPDMAGE